MSILTTAAGFRYPDSSEKLRDTPAAIQRLAEDITPWWIAGMISTGTNAAIPVAQTQQGMSSTQLAKGVTPNSRGFVINTAGWYRIVARCPLAAGSGRVRAWVSVAPTAGGTHAVQSVGAAAAIREASWSTVVHVEGFYNLAVGNEVGMQTQADVLTAFAGNGNIMIQWIDKP